MTHQSGFQYFWDKFSVQFGGVAILLALFGIVQKQAAASELHPELVKYVQARQSEFEQIPASRKAELEKLSRYIESRLETASPIQMTFICTHNSRRSHMAQLWAAVAATHYGVEQFKSYSGGTEATAFNPRAVAALQRAGLNLTTDGARPNPRYKVSCSLTGENWECFSKVYHSPPNPTANFCAVMTCSSADEDCPVVAGADARFAIPYVDPKISDNTPEESATYDERSAQIAREMFYVFSKLESK
ncbi:arsenate reductase/protein-tyrosine-phosphatase family protein [Thalassoglobus polymorphus]|uniref:Protein ArsC n=1 Tax=Thalassoglobus polymorphus TaxID=2527994 RepID=A0A517QI17_9PLAN|nr:protein-tyrosine-phosphatase [Thalassoglobus polymorphus]QDT31244.1 Protein ArsC [Thalassoglobus polymorphus]